MTEKTKQPTKKESPFKTAIQNLEFHKFDEEPNFLGMYKNTVELGEDDSDEKFTANIFNNVNTGEEIYIGNSYSIAKAIRMARAEYKEQLSNVVFSIEFLGKTEVKGKPFNQFKIGYCTLEEYEDSL